MEVCHRRAGDDATNRGREKGGGGKIDRQTGRQTGRETERRTRAHIQHTHTHTLSLTHILTHTHTHSRSSTILAARHLRIISHATH